MALGSGVKAGMQLETYKIDHIDFDINKTLGVLASTSHTECEVRFALSFRDVYKYSQTDKISYVTGLKIDLQIFQKDSFEEPVAKGTFVITGLFSTTNELEKDIEEKLLKFQAPAVLFPFLRSAISFTLTSAGFSTIILPLINVNAAAQSMELKIVEK